MLGPNHIIVRIVSVVGGCPHATRATAFDLGEHPGRVDFLAAKLLTEVNRIREEVRDGPQDRET